MCVVPCSGLAIKTGLFQRKKTGELNVRVKSTQTLSLSTYVLRCVLRLTKRYIMFHTRHHYPLCTSPNDYVWPNNDRTCKSSFRFGQHLPHWKF